MIGINKFLLFLWADMIVLLFGCAKMETDTGQYKGTLIEINCSLEVSSFEGEQPTRSNAILLPGELTDEEENKVRDLTVIQFNGTEEDSPIAIIRVFKNPDLTKNLLIGLLQPLDNKERIQTLYFIANAGETFSRFTGNLGELKTSSFSLSETDIKNGNIIMTGSCTSIIKTEITVSATLTRRLAKLIFTINSDELQDSRFEAVWLQLQSVPSVFRPEIPSGGTIYPEQNNDLYTNSEPIVNRIEDGYVWYIPENRRGTIVSGTGEAEKNTNKPANSTSIYLEGNYYPTNGNITGAKKVYYTLCPGNNVVSDFNVEGNKVYCVNLKITDPTKVKNDSRLNVIDMPEPLPGANCYMTTPGSTLTFSPFNSPGTDVAEVNFTYKDFVGTKASTNINHVGIVWQTAPGLIKEIYYLESGEIRLVTDNKSGNALVAAYDSAGNILWSWHIWITDYVVDNVNDNMANTSSAEVAGGNVYKWDDYIWMDRGIGATSAKWGFQSFGMIFQWGRKDPFLPGNDYTSTTVTPTYDQEGNRVYSSGEVLAQNPDVFNIFYKQRVLNNPMRFFVYSNNGLWYGPSEIKTLWSTTQKTIFDPCPAGWCVPSKAAAKNISSSNFSITYNTNTSQMTNNGLYCNALSGFWFPYVGYRYVVTGIPTGVGSYAVLWASDSGQCYGALRNVMEYGGRGHADGLLARCVKIKPTTN